MSSHTVCFKNLMQCLMYNLPVLTVGTVLITLTTTGYVIAHLIFGHLMKQGEPAIICLEMLVYGGGGAIVLWILGWTVFFVLPYLWREASKIPKTIRECIACKG